MFVENYRRENAESIMAGGESARVPYPIISDEDWRVWSTFLPVRSHNLDRKAVTNLSRTSFYEGIPREVVTEVQRAGQHFDKVEIWRQRQIDKDAIAVGVLGQERYLIARWGMEKLIPFDTIKKSMLLVVLWKCATSPFSIMVELAGVSLLAWHLLIG